MSKFPGFLVYAALLMPLSPAWAGPTFKLAGVEVTLPGEGWEVLPAKAPPGMIGGGGIDGTLPSEARLALLRDGGGRVQVAMLISSHFGAKRPVTLRGTCPPAREGDSSSHAVAIGHPMGGPRTCSVIAGPGDGDHLLGMIDTLVQARADHFFEAPSRAYIFWGYSVDQMATNFVVSGLLAEGFKGLEGAAPSKPLDSSFDPALAAWNEAFAASLKKSLSGVFSRSTEFPPISFTVNLQSR